ncbi:DRAP deaminase [Geopyxis carbonaria]|nr:DRAP deaminase [Geopyxis carbonaria]
MQQPFRYLPFSSPHFQLVTALLTLTTRHANTSLPMSTSLSSLPPLPPSPPPSSNTHPPRSSHAAQHGAKPDRRPRQRAKYVNPSKVANQPPDPLYYFEDGLRKVHPYYYTYNTFCKERWRDRKLVDVFLEEFRDRPEEYYTKAIAAGTVCVTPTDGQGQARLASRSGLDTIIRNGDMVSHTLHRHEPPVTSQPVRVVFEDADIIAISKPAGVPVHPTGRYNYNSVTEIMRSERSGFNPMPCNRLDRLTSGLMFIAKHRAAAERFMTQLKTRTVHKQYVARVRGRFPDGDVECDQPILLISPKLGLNRVRADGKHAHTLFRRESYHEKGDYSIVRCLPTTGRTHQLRVHLQFLGHPITNDPIYCNRRVWGASLGKGGAGDDEDIITRLGRMGKEEVADAEAYHGEVVGEYEKRKAEKMTGELCKVCETPLYSDPGPHELGIFLHALRYECEDGGWAYETPLPEWALEGEEAEGRELP